MPSYPVRKHEALKRPNKYKYVKLVEIHDYIGKYLANDDAIISPSVIR